MSTPWPMTVDSLVLRDARRADVERLLAVGNDADVNRFMLRTRRSSAVSSTPPTPAWVTPTSILLDTEWRALQPEVSEDSAGPERLGLPGWGV